MINGNIESAVKNAPATTLNAPVFVDSIPKAGTHLLSKTLKELPGIVPCGMHLDRRSIAKFVDPGVSFPLEGREDIDADRDFPWIEKLLSSVSAGTYLTAHFAYHKMIHNALEGLGFKIIVMVRDPRDIVLSWSDAMTRTERHLLFPYFSRKESSYRIMCGIVGESGEKTGTRRQPGIHELINWHLEWIRKAGALLIRFEDLVGEQGGGNQHRQLVTIQSISSFLNLDHDQDTIKRVADSLFGGTTTFNIGRIGRWQEDFSEKHRNAFKQVAGKELVELGYERDFLW